MIKVENLTKIYSNKKLTVKALDDISFTLPNTGMVFILGKSGSGKSTLLNMIGGLDNFTSGEITIDGNSFSKFKMKDYDDYHNEWLGFVFQDFCLIDDLNIYQNIALSLDLQRKTIDDTYKKNIENILSMVDLVGMGERKVTELSGGQKQRVAIARALVKKPRIILADEPTGNLDSKTSRHILELLKKLSKDRLVIIVSHNTDDAKTFADRIIELADGKIIRDEIKNEKFIDSATLNETTLTLPKDRAINEAEIEEINHTLQAKKSNKITKIKQGSSAFSPNKESTKDPYVQKRFLHRLKLRKKRALTLSTQFLKKRWLNSSVTVLIVSLLMFVFGLCQFMISLDTSEMFADSLRASNQEVIMAYKGQYTDAFDTQFNTSYCLDTTPDIEKFREAGYNDKIYQLYSIGAVHANNHLMLGYTVPNSSIEKFYATEACGTLVCDMDYITRIWGDEHGNINIIAGELDRTEYGIIITDYMADSYFYFKNKPIDYESLITTTPYRMPINAIIDTDYETRFAEAKNLISEMKNLKRTELSSEQIDVIMRAGEAIRRSYAICYTINSDFVEDYSTTSTSYTYLTNYYLSNNTLGLAGLGESSYIFYNSNYDLKDNEISMRVDQYNKLFKDSPGFQMYTDDTVGTFTPITFTLEKYPLNLQNNPSANYSLEITIKSLHKSTVNKGNQSSVYASRDLFNYFKKAELIPFALYFTNTDKAAELYEVFDELAYHLKSDLFTSIDSVGKMAKVFNQFFDIIIWVIFAAGVLLLVSFARQNIKRRTYDIGVMKSLGSTTREIGFIFGMQVFLVGILICIFSTIALYFGTTIVNGILVESVMAIVGTRSLRGTTILQFRPFAVIINATFVLTIILLTIIATVGRLHKIKPSQIIRSKE